MIISTSMRGLYCAITHGRSHTGRRFRGGGKGSDEEHITYSGGKEIFDLLQCGWGERKMKKKEENDNKIKCDKYVNYENSKLWLFYKVLRKYNIKIIMFYKIFYW